MHRITGSKVRWVMLPLAAAAATMMACGPEDDVLLATAPSALSSGSAKLDVLLGVLADRGVTPDKVHKALPGRLLKAKAGKLGGVDEVFVDALIEGTPAARAKLEALGARIRTVTPGGIMTATIPVSRIHAMAALDEVTRMEASKRVRLYNDLSNDLYTTASGDWAGMNNARTLGGAGVIVGVVDTGIDWTHKDFIRDATEGGPLPETRVLYYWDQSDTADDLPPAGFAYGHEYTAADLNNALRNFDNTWDPATNAFGPIDQAGYPIKASARDTDGHGTHVTGTAAGDGSGSGMMGGAPQADIISVKFDFDGDRNTDAAIIDGVNYIFQKAAALGRPAVINMSLGSDYGPHDGTTLEERGIGQLTGRGKVVVVAAGNPGANNWSPSLRWGFALHGSGLLNTEKFTFRFPTYASGTDNYVFFDVVYPKNNKCRVKVTTPSGKTYPPSTSQYKNTWITGSAFSGLSTPEGGILVQNGGDPFEMGATSGDIEAYIEVSDAYGTLPAVGTWTFQLVPATGTSVCTGTFHAWYGASDNLVTAFQGETVRNPTPRFNGRESDNKVTIGNPASGSQIIAVGAYQTREDWSFAYGTECLPQSTSTQDYATFPIHYYDPVAPGELVFFSARGPRRDAVLKPEISTPGVGIASSFSHFVRHDEWPNRCTSYWSGGPYHFGTNRVMPNLEATVIQGTSMACPNATGAVAVLMQQKRDLNDTCLRKVFSTSARHDTAVDTYAAVAGTAHSDTDTAAGPGKANNDWGYGKMDIAAALAALAPYPTCTGSCTVDLDCGTGKTCKAPTDPCGCNTCVSSCLSTGASCTANAQCCSGSCSGKVGKKVCK